MGGQRAETLINRLGVDDLRSLYYLCLTRAGWSKRGRREPLSFVYYEFGVGWGYTLTRYVEALKSFTQDARLGLETQRLFLFDSFEGLPASEGVVDEHPDWEEGSFAHSVDEIRGVLGRLGLHESGGNVTFTKGFFEQSLTQALRARLEATPPDIVTIDVDYYSSTKTILVWLRPLLRSGCLIYFDNLWSFNGSANRGELKAINEFNGTKPGTLTPFPLVPTVPSLYIYSEE